MSDLYTALQALRYDIRMKDINIKKGEVSQEELNKHLAQLKDLQDQAENLDFLDRDDSFHSDSN